MPSSPTLAKLGKRFQQRNIRQCIQNLLEPATNPHANMHVCPACAGCTQPGGPKRAMRGAVVLHNWQRVSPPPPPRTYHHQSRCTIPTAHIVRVRISGAFRVETPSFADFGVLRLHAPARYPDRLLGYRFRAEYQKMESF